MAAAARYNALFLSATSARMSSLHDALPPRGPVPPRSAIVTPRDMRGRALRDLRVSVTDRCNFRCTYCMPKEVFGKDYEFLPKDQVLSFEEIERLARAFVGLG